MPRSFVHAAPIADAHPVDVRVQPALKNRNRLTSAFRVFLALPHIILVGAPMAVGLTVAWRPEGGSRLVWGGAGALGAVAAVSALIAWFAIVFGSRQPAGLWSLSAYYLHWRVRAVSYVTLLRDEYPPFGAGSYPAMLMMPQPMAHRDRVSVAFRLFLALPHILVLWFMGVAWAVASIVAWFAILFTGRFPAPLYEFSVGMLRWTTRVEAYLLLLRDEFPPFGLD